MPYFRTQKEKNDYEEKMRGIYSNLPTPDLPTERKPVAPAKPKKKYRPHRSGYKLKDVMDQATLDKLYGYKRRLKRGKLVKSNNKGDQLYGRRRKKGERASNSQNQR